MYCEWNSKFLIIPEFHQRGCTQNVFLNFRKLLPEFWTFHSISDRKSRNLWSNGKRPGLSFFLEIWIFRKFPVPFGISTRYESAPVPLVVKSYQMAASLDAKWSATVRARIWFPGKLLTAGSEFPVGQFVRFACSPNRKVRKFLLSHMMYCYAARCNNWRKM